MNRSGDTYQRLDKSEDELEKEKYYRERGDESISGWIMFAVKAAATVYCARAFAVWWIKSIREEVEEED